MKKYPQPLNILYVSCHVPIMNLNVFYWYFMGNNRQIGRLVEILSMVGKAQALIM